MKKKIKGTELELQMVKLLFKHNLIGFRAPASGTYIVEDTPKPYVDLQKECNIKIEGIEFIDFGFRSDGYQTSDYSGFFSNSISSRIKTIGTFDPYEFRFIELKTVRLRDSHLTSEERKLQIFKESLDAKFHTMKETFNLLQKDTRSVIKIRTEADTAKKNNKNPYYNQLRKSDFCMELQRTYYMELLMRKNITDMLSSIGIYVESDRLPIYAYLQVRFIKANVEIWIRIKDLITYQDYTKTKLRDPKTTMLDIIKDEKNNITWTWRINNKLQ